MSDVPHPFSEPAADGMKCPICGRRSAPQELPDGQRSPYPFCSERCRLVDLGRWLDGRYQIPADPDDRDESDPPATPPPRP